MARAGLALAGFGALLSIAPAAAPAMPAAGHYDARLCVSVADQAPNCGDAQARLAPAGRLQLQVSDIVYRLHFRATKVEVLTMHGSMQIDEFTTAFDWAGPVLHFSDPDKAVRYEVQLGARQRTPK
jgi:hypothetical protein